MGWTPHAESKLLCRRANVRRRSGERRAIGPIRGPGVRWFDELVSELRSSWFKAATRERHTSSTLSQGYFPPSSMSLSPTDSTLASPVIPSKRRRAHTNQQLYLMDESSTASGATPGHIPKRGARACTACRKGKNRCEGEVSKPISPAPSPVPLTAPAGPSLPPRPG